MNKQFFKTLPFIIGAIFLVAWSAIILTLVNLPLLGGLGWFAFLFVLFSFALVSFVEPFTQGLRMKNDNVAAGLPLFYSGIFLLLSVLINSAFLLLHLAWLGKILVVVDIALVALYLGLVFSSLAYLNNMKEKTGKVAAQTGSIAQLSGKLGQMLAVNKDEEVRKGLLGLKETVDYSSMVPGDAAAHNELSGRLQTLHDAILAQAKKEDVLVMIQQAKDAWLSAKASGRG